MRKRFLILTASVAMVAALMLPVLIFPTVAVAQPLDWERANADGFGFAPPEEMGSAQCMAEYRGKLYAGTINYFNGLGSAVWRYDGGTTWTQVGFGGFGNTNNIVTYSMAVYNDLLYVGTGNWNGCEVWSYDGTNWTQVVSGGFGHSSYEIVGKCFITTASNNTNKRGFNNKKEINGNLGLPHR